MVLPGVMRASPPGPPITRDWSIAAKCEVLKAIFSTTPIATTGKAAHRNTAVAPSSTPAAASHKSARTTAHECRPGDTAASATAEKRYLAPKAPYSLRPPPAAPCAQQQHDRLREPTVIAKRHQRKDRIGMLAFDNTVVRSETGRDFQNRMLRSRRSPCSASSSRSGRPQSGSP